ncbi:MULTISPECIES: SMP-30/gluconolactonase/LRE family protein [unclassified Arthrobacter]|uniref:SMP-30/gluconolactonase/LRE family protein n=1 Tax=unclassified Arthrobacter TaxID=235627 RepID=UPI001E589B3E|nr:MULTISPECIES: SMP-30/gluconolactonase/LRE family protein [unclassified Arthrobacter]MCC9145268.1 SMP-30/gluconolactonase/LRE family protein [Arthrobacter sp. zg-Y919]MDK1276496.1 SMP-30/gluconolactonase/LRE family protein [Arthrobacter sp. zg.Y919]WIB01909.1 SMP-30/gluconolactonase/LRE family protein [Arthrobacter sp. zg-Y919]
MAELTTLVSGIGMGESARWHAGELWFADWTAGTISALDSGGNVRRVSAVPSFPISFDWLPDGRMVVVSGTDGTVLLEVPNAGLVPHTDLAGISDYPWNEIAVHPSGNIYVNGIGYDYSSAAQASGIIALIRPDGSVDQVADGLAFPNGMLVSDDGGTLVVAESNAGRLASFAISGDGSLTPDGEWAGVSGSAPDGICWDGAGGIWFAEVPGERCVHVREGGTVLDTVQLDRGCFSCATGGEDGGLLFMMAAQWPEVLDPEAGNTGQVLGLRVR